MESCDIEYFEQVLPVWDIEGTARLCASLDTPILIDEGVYTPHDLMRLIRARALGAVNIKVLKTGLTGGREIAAIAAAAGLPVVVGSAPFSVANTGFSWPCPSGPGLGVLPEAETFGIAP